MIALSAIVVVGLFLRAYLSLRWRPALLGFPDSTIYMETAHGSAFGNPLRAGGYGIFLQILHWLRPHLAFAIRVQHLLGICSGLLLFGALRRAGLPRGLGLIPAAIVILSGDEILIEHAPLTEPLFVFLTALSLYAVVRTWRGHWAWALLAGLALGAATGVRTLGLLLAVVLIAVVAVIYTGGWRARGLRVGLMALATAAPILAYLIGHNAATGVFGFTTAGNFNLYARVAPFADCSKFTPPSGTSDLCISTPVNKRGGPNTWVFSDVSPAVDVYGEPDITTPTPGENAHLEAFAKSAIVGQPLQYLEYVARDLVRVVDPSYSSSPYGNRGVTGTGYGDTPAALTSYYFNQQTTPGAEQAAAAYYSDGVTQESIGLLMTWERDTRVEGPFMAVLLALALLSPLLARGHRRAAVLFLAATVVLVAGPVFLVYYDYRYVIPAFGALSCSAAIGAWGVYLQGRRLLTRVQRPRRTRTPVAA